MSRETGLLLLDVESSSLVMEIIIEGKRINVQCCVDGGILRSQLQWKSFLRFEGEAQIVGGTLELAAD